MATDRQLRNVILILVDAVRLYKARAYTANDLLNTLMVLPPTKRAETTPQSLQSDANRIRAKFEQDASREAQQVIKALEGDGDYYFALQIYASKQHWN
jgi:hypothetical protein